MSRILMLGYLQDHPGRIYVIAALLPLIPAVVALATAAMIRLVKSTIQNSRYVESVDRKSGVRGVPLLLAYSSVGFMSVVATLSLFGLAPFLASADGTHGKILLSESSESLDDSPPATQASNSNRHRLILAERREWLRIGSGKDKTSRASVAPNGNERNRAATADSAKSGSDGRAVPSSVGSSNQQPTCLYIGYSVDTLTALLFTAVAIVSVLVFVFSLGYMGEEKSDRVHDHGSGTTRRGRFALYFAYLSLFVSAMFNLLIADNLLQIFICWELVGACSYLLIGFHSERPVAAAAATKAFVVNRIGDVGFLLAIVLAWSTYGTLTVSDLSAAFVEGPTTDATDWVGLGIGLGLFLGAVGKSAQVPLHVWLPDAMAGPTPVSALIHAATMVAAGVYLCARCQFLFTPEVYWVIAYVGCVTMLLGATSACVQTDIKRVLAYSTVSQLGLMMLGIGVAGAGVSAAVFHLLTHAFFKALLFLAAGSVIHALHHEQDLRSMGGLRQRMPFTAAAMLVGVLAIGGFPFFSGWYSKEILVTAIIEAAVDRPQHVLLPVAALVTVVLTAYYMFRFWLLIFAGTSRHPAGNNRVHESAYVITMPLLALMFFSFVVGSGWPPWDVDRSFLFRIIDDDMTRQSSSVGAHGVTLNTRANNDVLFNVKDNHLLIEGSVLLMGLLGYAVAGYRHMTLSPVGGSSFFLNAWHFDKTYQAALVRPALWLGVRSAAVDKRAGSADDYGPGQSARRVDLGTLDGWFNSFGLTFVVTGDLARRIQTGFVRGYVVILGLTVVCLLGMLVVLIH